MTHPAADYLDRLDRIVVLATAGAAPPCPGASPVAAAVLAAALREAAATALASRDLLAAVWDEAFAAGCARGRSDGHLDARAAARRATRPDGLRAVG